MRISNFRPDERHALLLFSLIMFVNMLTLEATFVMSTSGFLDSIGANQLPLLWIIDMGLIVVGTTIISAVIDRWPRKQFLSWIIFGLAFFYLFMRMLFSYGVPEWGSYPFLYMLAEQQVLVIPIVFWAMANDIFSIQQTKRIFPLIAASGVIGGIVGNTLAISLANYFGSRGRESYDLLFINAVLLFLLFIAFQILSQRIPASDRQSRADDTFQKMFADGWDFVRNVAVFRYLAIAMLGVGFVITMIEFNFLDVINANFQGSQFQSFFGLYRIGQTISIVLVQSLLASRLLNLVDLKRIFSFMSGASVLIILIVLFIPGVFASALARLFGRTILFGIDEPARKSLQGLIPDEKRGRVSSFLDGYLYAIGTIFGSLLLVLLFWVTGNGWLTLEGRNWAFLLTGGIVAFVSIWATTKLWLSYDTSMLDWRLARRKRRSSVLDMDF
ncbi:MAG: hypothetical protein ISR58_18185 [Anaerolineales bacterium]|nr:hypothetical protein [Chloroflexota bacterium]MBL6983108.1 hypothetical protein [Anaerolineales bacterium]